MAESSESKMKFVPGTLVWINLNLEKDKEWEKEILLAHPNMVGSVLQTYLIHSHKENSRENPDLWFMHQSNVHGVVVASTILSAQESEQYPKFVGDVAEYFLPGVAVVEKDFTQVNVRSTKKRLDAFSCSSVHRISFFTALEEGLQILCEDFHRKKTNKKGAQYIAASQGKVRVVKVAAALRLHTRFDDAIIENIVSFLTSRCLSDRTC